MALPAIGHWLARHTGLCPDVLGEASLRRAVAGRQQATGQGDAQAYLQLLLANQAEQQALVDQLVVPESWFFRDRQPFAVLAAFACRHLREAGGRPLRLLSAPCANGEEPYSMAITLLDQGLDPNLFMIDAVDISGACLERARRAVYGRHAFRGVTAAERRRHFQASADGWALNANVRSRVHFRQANLTEGSGACLDRYDVVFCRNLIIHLHRAAARAVIDGIAGLVRPGGLLLVGAAEMAWVPTSLFEPLHRPCAAWFRRRCDAPAPAASDVVAGQVAVPADPGVEGRQVELERCRRLIRRDPTSASAYLRMADLLMEGDQHGEALAFLRKGLYLRPRSRDILQRLISLTRTIGQGEESRRFQERLSRLEP